MRLRFPSFSLLLAFSIVGGMMRSANALDVFSHRQGHRPEIFIGTDLSEIKKSYPRSSLLQQEMMDFSDRYTAALLEATDEYLLSENDPVKRTAAEQWKISFSAASMEIAAERETATSLLDMAVFMNISEWSVRNYWVPEIFGAKGQPFIAAHQRLKNDLDAILAATLTDTQLKQLSGAIGAWKKIHPKFRNAADVRLRDIATVRGVRDQLRGIFPLLSDLRHMLGRVDDAFQYGERVMFYLERLSRLMTMHTSLAVSQTASSPSVVALQHDADVASTALVKLPTTIDQLPSTITTSLLTNASTLQGLLPGIQATLADTKALTESLERMQKAHLDNPNTQLWTPDKTLTALASLEAVTKELNGTLQHADQLAAGATNLGPPISVMVKDAHERSRLTIDDLFLKILIAMGLFFAGVIVTLLIAVQLFKKKS